jgi:hypothetical protein
MKTKLAFLALVIVCSWGREASADTITTGNLSFSIFDGSCINVSPGDGCTAPTAGSFVYDNTTNQFSSITVTWDGFELVGRSEGSGEQTAYLELIGASSSQLVWSGLCTAGTITQGHCGGEFGFAFFDHSSVNIGLGPLSTPNPEFPNDSAGGIVTATDLVTTTPEPTAAMLLMLGISSAFALRKRFAQGGHSAA